MKFNKTEIKDKRSYPTYEIVIEYMHGDAYSETFDRGDVKDKLELEKIVTFCNELMNNNSYDPIDYETIPFYDEFQTVGCIPDDATSCNHDATLYSYKIYYYDSNKIKYSVEIGE